MPCESETIIIKEQSGWKRTMIFTDRAKVPQSIAGYTFVGRFLDSKGGKILLEIQVNNLEDAGGGTGEFQPVLTQAQATKFRNDNTLPGWFELYMIEYEGADQIIWIDTKVEYRNGGR